MLYARPEPIDFMFQLPFRGLSFSLKWLWHLCGILGMTVCPRCSSSQCLDGRESSRHGRRFDSRMHQTIFGLPSFTGSWLLFCCVNTFCCRCSAVEWLLRDCVEFSSASLLHPASKLKLYPDSIILAFNIYCF